MVKKSFTFIYRLFTALLWLVIIVLGVGILSLRYVVFPNIDSYKDEITKHASAALGQKVTIDKIQASWSGITPHLKLINVQLYDNQNRPALGLKAVETGISWLSVPLMEPRLSQLLIDAPNLIIRRESDGNVFIAGIPMGGESNPDLTNWLLRQARLDITNATVTWNDEMRNSPELSLTQVQFTIKNPTLGSLVGRHQVSFSALPSTGTVKPLLLRADLYGRDISHLEKWDGEVFGQMEGVDIAAWRPWVSYPIDLSTGYGAMRFWFNFENGKPKSLTSDVALAGVKTKLTQQSKEANLNKLSGRLIWKQFPDGQEIRAERINVDSVDGLKIDDGLVDLRQGALNGKSHIEGDIQLKQINLTQANSFAHYLPLPQSILQKLDSIAPTGQLLALSLQWKGDDKQPSEYALSTEFKNLGLQPYEKIPGFSNISGTIQANEKKGELRFNTSNAVLDFKHALRWPVPIDKLAGAVRWSFDDKQTEIRLIDFTLNSKEIVGSVNGLYRIENDKSDYIDLVGKFPFADAKTAKHYYPNSMGRNTVEWLDKSILAGKIKNINVTLKGNVDDIPFKNKQGILSATADLSETILDYGNGWPRLDGLKLKMKFQGPSLELVANDGRITNTRITNAHGWIPDLDAEDPILTINGEATGLVKDGIAFINTSPLLKITDGFTQTLLTSGNGKLNLQLILPLNDTDRTKVKGTYQINNGSMMSESIPDLSKINGTLAFTEHELSAKNVRTWLFGGPAQFNLNTGKNKLIKIAASGKVTDAGLKQGLKLSLLERLSGTADWTGDIAIQQEKLDIDVRTNLVGMASNWPAPLNKTAAEAMPFKYNTKQETSSQDMMSINLANYVAAKFLRTRKNGSLEIDRGQVGINVSPEITNQDGIVINVVSNELDGDEWLSAISQAHTSGKGKKDSLNFSAINLSVNNLDFFNHNIYALKLQAKPLNDNNWKMSIQSQEVVGDATWFGDGNGKVSANLKKLIVISDKDSTNQAAGNVSAENSASTVYPALDISADSFEFEKRSLGSLELKANEKGNNWNIEKLTITNPDSTLMADGEWRNWKKASLTHMNVNWNISNLGSTLERFGQPKTIQGGTASIQGQLSWPKSPHEFDMKKLNGNLRLDTTKGQILKIQPGVGRLFSLLSLQNLPRRLIFDFKDVFNDGFAFDSISANVRIEQGLMRSDNFKLKGPTALVEMKGETDLSRETQHLFIKVTPYISDSLSLAALAGGPAVAAAAFVAQKLLRDPLNKIARDQYEIVGTWDNPIEIKSEAESKPVVPETKPLGR